MTSTQRKSAKLAALIKKTAQKLVNSPKQLQKLALTLPLLALFVEEVRAAQGKSQGQVFEDLQALTDFVEAQNLDEAQYAEIEASLDDVQLAANDVNAQDAAAVAEEETEKALLLEEEGAAAGKKKAGALLEPTGEAGAAGRGLAAEAAESEAAALAGEQAAAAGAAESFELAGLIIPVAPAPLFGAVAAGLGLVTTNTGGGATDTETATGTTLSRTLKQLKTDGIAFVQPATGSNVINVELGTGAALANTTGLTLFGDTDRSGSVSAAENAALTVNLVITNADQLAEVAALSGLKEFGIDSVRIDLSNQDLLNALTSDATLADHLAAIRDSGLGLTVTTIDMGASASLTEAQATMLIDNGLSFAADDVAISLQADSGTGTHLSNSLKDLQKLGVDAISAVGDVGHVVVDFDSASGIAAGNAFSAAGLPVFAAGLDVTLNVDSTQIGQVTGNVAALSGTANIDHLNINLMDAQAGTSGAGYANELSDMIGSSGFSSLSTFMPSTIDLGGSAVEAVSINQTQAAQLIGEGLHFAAADTITLDATLTAGNTHLGTSLKDLNKLGVDAVSVTGADAVNVDLDGLTTADLGTGGALASFDEALRVTLNVADVDEFGTTAGLASQLHAAHIDNVKLDVLDTNTDDDFEDQLIALLDDLSFTSAVSALSAPSVSVGTTLDLGGASIAGHLLIHADQTSGLVEHGIGFAANDQIAMDTQMLAGAHSTHLGHTLKDLQKLGVDSVSVVGAVTGDDLHIDFGRPEDSNPLNLATGGLPQFASNLDVTVHAANGSQLNELGTLANTAGVDLGALGIDHVQLNFGNQAAFDSLFGSAPSLMSTLAATSPVTTLEGAVTALTADNVHIDPLDFASNAGHLSDSQAQILLEQGLTFAANDIITLQADAGSTHLTTSLKDLQKLGVDAVTVTGAAAGADLSLALGNGSAIDLASGALPSFGVDSALNVTLDVTSASQLAEVATLAGAVGVNLATLGFDNVELNLAGQTELNTLLAANVGSNPSLGQNLSAVRNEGLSVTTIDIGGFNREGVVHLSADQMGSVIDAGLHFAAADHVTVDVASTFHSAGVPNLAQFGVDTVHITDAENITSTTLLDSLIDQLQAVGVNELGISSSDFEANSALTDAVNAFNWLASGADFALQVDTGTTATPQDVGDLIVDFVTDGVDVLSGVGLADDAKWGDLIDTLQEAGLGNVEMQTTAKVHISDDLSAALYESGMLHALPDAAIAIDAGANKVLNTSLKAMADLGVDSVNAGHKVYVELGLNPQDASTLADLGHLFSAFGLDSAAPDTHLFGAQGAGLVVDQATFDNFSGMDAASVEQLLGDLTKLGFTEVDVMGASAVSAVYQINVTAQTPVLSQVALIGTDINDLAHVFDPDILNKPIK